MNCNYNAAYICVYAQRLFNSLLGDLLRSV